MTIYECPKCGKWEVDHTIKDCLRLLFHSWFKIGCTKEPKETGGDK